MLWNEKNDKSDKYREMYIWRNDFRIEIIGFDRMYDCNHDNESDDDWETSKSISKYHYRNAWEKSAEYWNKSSNKDDEWKRKNKWKYWKFPRSPDKIAHHYVDRSNTRMDHANDNESNGRKDSIYHSDDGLCLENKSETDTDFPSDNGPLVIEKLEVPVSDLTKKCFDTYSLY